MLTKHSNSATLKLIESALSSELAAEMMIDTSEITEVRKSIECLFLCYLQTPSADDSEERTTVARHYQAIVILLDNL